MLFELPLLGVNILLLGRDQGIQDCVWFEDC